MIRFVITTLVVAIVGCGSASVSRAQARGAVLVTAEAVKLGDETCAATALEKKDLELAKTCESAYALARASLIVAATSVDAWDEGKKGDVACAIKRAADQLAKTASELRRRNAAIPKIIDDALSLALSVGSCT